MDTRFLETFVAVAEKGSFAEAARRLDLTPAAIAQRIRALESEIGVVLLSRSGRTVSPTEAGVAILGQTKSFSNKSAILDQSQQAVSRRASCAWAPYRLPFRDCFRLS